MAPILSKGKAPKDQDRDQESPQPLVPQKPSLWVKGFSLRKLDRRHRSGSPTPPGPYISSPRQGFTTAHHPNPQDTPLSTVTEGIGDTASLLASQTPPISAERASESIDTTAPQATPSDRLPAALTPTTSPAISCDTGQTSSGITTSQSRGRSGDVKGTAPGNLAKTSYVSVLERAFVNMKNRKSPKPLVLEATFKDLVGDGFHTEGIEKLLEEQGKIVGKGDVSASGIRRAAKAFSSTKDLGMGLARLDPSKITPVVLGAAYYFARGIEAKGDDDATAKDMCMDIIATLVLWNCLEKHQMMRQHSESCQALYESLEDKMVHMYEKALTLLEDLMLYLQNRGRQYVSLAYPRSSKWEDSKRQWKSFEKQCDVIKSQIKEQLDSEEKDSKILKWISSHDISYSYRTVQSRTQMDQDSFRDRCQWLVETTEFKNYKQGKAAVLWLKGSMGTGKTTLMVRAIREIEESAKIEDESTPFAKFFFVKSVASDDTSVDACLHSLARQLSWNHATASIEPAAQKLYNDLRGPAGESSLTTPDCVKLLQDLVSTRETYIMIDGIDECEKPGDLLEKLRILEQSLKGRHKTLRLMLCGRGLPLVSNYFMTCSQIETRHPLSSDDEKYFVNKAIRKMKMTHPGSLFVKHENNYPDRLGRILKDKANGLFRWIEIQIDIFTNETFRDSAQIEEELDKLKASTMFLELEQEYEKLIAKLNEGQRVRAIRLLKFIACSFWPLHAAALAQAVTAYEKPENEATADDVRRLLIGFVSEVSIESLDIRRGLERWEGESQQTVLQIGHASVLEYLLGSRNRRSSAERFTTSTLHYEAALLCFASISDLRCRNPTSRTLSVSVDQPNPGRDTWRDKYRESVSDLFYYSCRNWPRHCQIVFSEDITCSTQKTLLLRKTRDFILGDSYLTWNRAIYKLPGRRRLNISHDPRERRPGFVIARYDLVELLKFPPIMALVNFADVNKSGKDLFRFICTTYEVATVRSMLEMFGCTGYQWNGDLEIIKSAIVTNCPEIAETAMNGRGVGSLYTESISKGLAESLRVFRAIRLQLPSINMQRKDQRVTLLFPLFLHSSQLPGLVQIIEHLALAADLSSLDHEQRFWLDKAIKLSRFGRQGFIWKKRVKRFIPIVYLLVFFFYVFLCVSLFVREP